MYVFRVPNGLKKTEFTMGFGSIPTQGLGRCAREQNGEVLKPLSSGKEIEANESQ